MGFKGKVMPKTFFFLAEPFKREMWKKKNSPKGVHLK